MLIKLERNLILIWLFFTEFSISIRTSKYPEFDYEFIALLIRISFDFANISNGEFLPKIAAKLKIYSILFTFRLTAGLFDQRVRSIWLSRQTKFIGGSVG